MPAKKIAAETARMGLLFALAICLSYVESLVPPFLPVPGVKLGLSNVVTMCALFLLGPRPGFLLAALKSIFAVMTRGAVAGLLSLAGGLLSVAVMALLLAVTARRAGAAMVSIAGAVAHNVGQLVAAAVILRLGAVLWYYLPLLVAAGAGMGLLTAVLLRAVLPLLRRN